MMLFLMPQSTATMRGDMPSLNTSGVFSDTSTVPPRVRTWYQLPLSLSTSTIVPCGM